MYGKAYQAETILRKKKRRPFPKELIENVNAGEDLFTALSYQRIKELNRKVKSEDKPKRYGKNGSEVLVLDDVTEQPVDSNCLMDSFDTLLTGPSAEKPNNSKHRQIKPIKKKNCVVNSDSSYLYLLDESRDVDSLQDEFRASRDKLRRSKEERRPKIIQQNTSLESIAEESSFSKHKASEKSVLDSDCELSLNEKCNDRKKQLTMLESSTPAKYVTNESVCVLSPIYPVMTQFSSVKQTEECDEITERRERKSVTDPDLIQLCFELSLDLEQHGNKSNIKAQKCVIGKTTKYMPSADNSSSNSTKQIALNKNVNNSETVKDLAEKKEVMTLPSVHSPDPFAGSENIDGDFHFSYERKEELANNGIRKIPSVLEESQDTQCINQIDSSACSSILDDTKQTRKNCDELYQDSSCIEKEHVDASITQNAFNESGVQLRKARYYLRNKGRRQSKCQKSLCLDSQKPENDTTIEISNLSEMSESSETNSSDATFETYDLSEKSETTDLSEILEMTETSITSRSFTGLRCDKYSCLDTENNKNKCNTIVEHSSSDVSKMNEATISLSDNSINHKVLTTSVNISESIKNSTSVPDHCEKRATTLIRRYTDFEYIGKKSFAPRRSHLVVNLVDCKFDNSPRDRSSGFRDVYFGSPARKQLTYRNSICPTANRNPTMGQTIDQNYSVLQEESISVEDDVDELTFKDVVLEHCMQTEILVFDETFRHCDLEGWKKIGEGVYGEVFSRQTVEGQQTVLKIMPIEGKCNINGETQKTYEEILPEIVITRQLSNLRENENFCIANFPELIRCWCVQGTYPSRLLDLWHEYDKERSSENDSPEILPKDQIYIILELNNVGSALEGFTFNSAEQALSAFMQVAYSLAVSECALQFEHRDLHWGNILIQRTKDKTIACKLYGEDQIVYSYGIQASVIDFTLSRITYAGCCIYNNLAEDPALFEGVGDYQFDIYRKMRDETENNWQVFRPYNNVLWLSYVLEKLIAEVNYRNEKSKVHKRGMSQLILLRKKILDFKTATEIALHLSS